MCHIDISRQRWCVLFHQLNRSNNTRLNFGENDQVARSIIILSVCFESRYWSCEFLVRIRVTVTISRWSSIDRYLLMIMILTNRAVTNLRRCNDTWHSCFSTGFWTTARFEAARSASLCSIIKSSIARSRSLFGCFRSKVNVERINVIGHFDFDVIRAIFSSEKFATR